MLLDLINQSHVFPSRLMFCEGFDNVLGYLLSIMGAVHVTINREIEGACSGSLKPRVKHLRRQRQFSVFVVA